MMTLRNSIVGLLVLAVFSSACIDQVEATGSTEQNVASPTVGTSQASYGATDPVTVTYSGMPGNAHDWVAVSPANSPDTSYLQWTYINGQTDGTAGFDPLPVGSYEARAYVNDSYTVLARASFTVTGSTAVSVSTNKTTYTVGETVTVTFANLPGNTYDWVAISPAGSPATSYTKWDYTNGQVNGTQAFTGITSGQWEARAYSNDTFTVIASSAFTVASTPTVSPSSSIYAANAPITINFSGLPGNQNDWIALAAAGSPDTSYIAFKYTGGLVAGSKQFAGLAAGNYETRAYLNDTFTKLASATFTVSSNGSTTPAVSTSAPSYSAGQVVTVNYMNLPGNAYDWVAVSVAGSPATSYVKWAYTGGAVNGTQNFTSLPAGNYEARVYSNDSYNLLTSSTFTITP